MNYKFKFSSLIYLMKNPFDSQETGDSENFFLKERHFTEIDDVLIIKIMEIVSNGLYLYLI